MIRANAPCIVLAAGGTGGHVFPAEALARELLSRGCRPVLVTDKRGGAYGGALAEIETRMVRSGAIMGQGMLARARSFASLGIGALQAFSVLGELKPAVVIGFGGYPSVPTMIVANRRGIRTAIHEQNAILGRANRFLSSRVDRIATSLPGGIDVDPALEAKVVYTGMPSRPAVIAARDVPYPVPDDEGPLNILVLGGSQGAHVFSEVLPQAVARLPEGLRARLKLAQHCRQEDIEGVREDYRKSGFAAELSTFFTDVPERLAAAHLLIARAGASTISEMMTIGRPAILIPYPFAADDHQNANAQSVEKAGGGWVMAQDTFTPDSLAQRLQTLFTDPALLRSAAAAARAAARIDAAQRLADAVLELVSVPESTWKASKSGRAVS